MCRVNYTFEEIRQMAEYAQKTGKDPVLVKYYTDRLDEAIAKKDRKSEYNRRRREKRQAVKEAERILASEPDEPEPEDEPTPPEQPEPVEEEEKELVPA